MPDFDALPLILAGPILRRVEPTLVSVWVALSRPCTVEMGIWAGQTAVPTSGTLFGNTTALHSGFSATIRIGEKLHLALVTVDLQTTPLAPGITYAYNLVFVGADGDADLSTEEYLVDKGPAVERTQLALGYVPGELPTFALPPTSLENLQLIHGSCRKAHGHGPDGLSALDTIIERSRTDPLHRPHQLFMTGDQVYADDIAMVLLPQLTDAGNALLFGNPDPANGEKLPLKTNGAETKVAITRTSFPATWRQELSVQQAGFTSSAASCHALSFGEFCALYLFFWSNVLWEKVEDFKSVTDLFRHCPEDEDQPCSDPDLIVRELPDHLQPLYPPDECEERVEARNELRKSYAGQLDDVKAFVKGLPKVRRALANVPSYMMFDDHEVTDDWYLTQEWRDRVLSLPLGVTVLRNGLLAFALFQAWGNTPLSFGTGKHAQVLALAQALFPATGGPHPASANQLDALFGFAGGDPADQVEWHFTVPTGPTTTVVLDTRTQRSFEHGRYGPPGLLSHGALQAQFPATLVPSPGEELLFVVSPAPVLGLALIEELAQPVGGRAGFDFLLSTIWRHDPEITGYMEFDMEAWSLDAARFEALLARMNEMKKVVILSGDVHFACTVEMDYWKKNQLAPSRIVQLTASAFKNDWGAAPKRALETVTGQQILQDAFYPAERLGWSDPVDLVGNVSVPGGDMPRSKRAMLRRTPAVLPTEGWPPGSSISVDPDWSWRMSLVKDERPDDNSPGARPADGQLAPISPDLDPDNPVDGYLAVLQRGEKQLKVKLARSVVFHSNLGRVTFTGSGSTLRILHELMYVHPSGSVKPADPQAYTAHEVSLDTSSESPPSIG